jgi:hypothetical protein
MSVLSAFQNVIDKIDVENTEFYLLGDFNCDLLSERPDSNRSELLNISSLRSRRLVKGVV